LRSFQAASRFVVWAAAPLLVAAIPHRLAAHAARPLDAEAAEAALRALSVYVSGSSNPDALRVAFEAYYRFRADHPDEVGKPYLYFVDLGLDNRTPRGYMFDMELLQLVEGPFHVAHGSGSLGARDGVPARFSNEPGSRASSLGLYLAKETYSFRGSVAGRPYTSIGLRLIGESGRFNDAAEARRIVAHGAPYVTATRAGRSEGCPAMEPARAVRLLPLLANGGVVFIYSPNDSSWLEQEPWLRS
jgi:hypothetical protein